MEAYEPDEMERMYEAHTILPDGTERIKYAYGLPWVAMALYMDDICFDTPEEAIAWWEKTYGRDVH